MDDLNKLEILRQGIDETDEKLIALFQARMTKVLEIAEYKAANNLEILNEAREKEVLEKINHIQDIKLRSYAAEFFRALMGVSRRYQSDQIKQRKNNYSGCPANSNHPLEDVKAFLALGLSNPELNQADNPNGHDRKEARSVGFQGLEGSYSEQALKQYFGENTTGISYQSFEDVFKGLQEDKIDFGVLPLENSFTGGIAEVYDLLCACGFYIVGEVCVQVDHNLLAPQGTRLEDIREIYSHPQALLQCSQFLKTHPQWNQIPCSNTAVSAKYVSDLNTSSKASIASRRAAELYGLSILADGINNNEENFTRFIIIGRYPVLSTKNNKISLAVAITHEPGSLYRILSHFARNSLNMLKIESRPIKDRTWEYLFYIDFEGNLENQEVKQAVNEIKNDSTYFRLLGNYRAAKLNHK